MGGLWGFSCMGFLGLLLSGDSDSVDWCDETRACWAGQKHMRCLYKEQNSSTQCPNIKSVITPEERKWILHYHNAFRNDVAAGRKKWTAGKYYMKGWETFSTTVGDMRQMVWDYDMEDNARIYASQCSVNTFRSYQCAQTKDTRVVHMNKFNNQAGKLFMHDAVENFVQSKKSTRFYYSDYVLARRYIPGPWDDFFATVFSQTFRLGCAKVLCGCNQIKPLHETGSIVCIYGPVISGGSPIFERASPCDACPSRTGCRKDSRYKYLCAREKDPIQPENIPSRNGRTTLIHSTPFQVLRMTFFVIVTVFLKYNMAQQ